MKRFDQSSWIHIGAVTLTGLGVSAGLIALARWVQPTTKEKS
jgi:hypothetical protein